MFRKLTKDEIQLLNYVSWFKCEIESMHYKSLALTGSKRNDYHLMNKLHDQISNSRISNPYALPLEYSSYMI